MPLLALSSKPAYVLAARPPVATPRGLGSKHGPAMAPASRLSCVDRRHVLRGLAAAAALAPAPGHAEDKDRPAPAGIEAIEVNSRPIDHFERGRSEATRFGPLQFRGGLVLSSPSADFGGWSGLVMAPDGHRLLAVSDVGSWMTADVGYAGTRPMRLERARIGPLLDSGGRHLDSKKEADAESVTLLDGDLRRGTLLVGFERHHRIDRYPIRDGIVQPSDGGLKLPAEAKRMPNNQGIEALAVLKGGRYAGAVVAFAERFTRGSGYHTGWLWIGGGEPQRFQLQDIEGFNITDAAALPGGGLIVLERFFRWTEGVKMRLRLIPAAEVAPGVRTAGRILFQGESNYEIDNMEGLAVHKSPSGETVLTLISDDNFNHFLQRTVLLQFALVDDDVKRASPPRT